jgi:hypothetical protein
MNTEDKNDMAYWFPILQSTGVLVPRTEIIKTDVELIALMDGKKPDGFDEFVRCLRAAADEFGYPAFLRTGQTSGKHFWNRTCFLESADNINQCIYELVEFSEIADFIGLPYGTWAVREFLNLESSFTAFPGRMPVNMERRYFIEDGHVLCHHPYWPAYSIEDQRPSAPNWRDLLGKLNLESDLV